MLIGVGYEVTLDFVKPSPVVLMPYIHPSRTASIRQPERLMARGRAAADVALTTTFGTNQLQSFQVWTDEIREDGAVRCVIVAGVDLSRIVDESRPSHSNFNPQCPIRPLGGLGYPFCLDPFLVFLGRAPTFRAAFSERSACFALMSPDTASSKARR